MTRLLRRFWIAYFVTLTMAVLLIHVTWRPQYRQLPPRPPLWLGGETYLSEYGTHGSPAHYIYRFGLFRIDERLDACQLIFLGSSHVEYGVSAAQAASELTRATGHPVHAYNAAVGFGEGFGFAKEVMSHNIVPGATVVLDLFSPRGEGGSPYDRIVGNSNTLGAYLKVWDTWLRYDDDYLLDPLVPRFSTQTGSKLSEAIVRTRLLGVCNMRYWDSGDVDELWSPTTGPQFKNPAPGIPQRMDQADPERIAGYGEWKLSPDTVEFFEDCRMAPAFTLIPFEGYEYTTTPATAAPFLPVSSDGLLFFDQVHLTAAGRTLATSRLVEDILRDDLAR